MDLKVGLLGSCAFNDFHKLTGGNIMHSVEDALKKDILIFTGGADIHPFIYKEKNRHSVGMDLERDLFEWKVFTHAAAHGIKILGICRGHQLINALLGGKLHQDIMKEVRSYHARQEFHTFVPIPSRFWHGCNLGEVFPRVNSYHHQAVSVPGQGMDILLRSRDNIIEATANHDGSIVTFQFHPEWDNVGSAYFQKVMETGNLIW